MLALRIIVEWDGAVVEDRLYQERDLVLVGSGPAATSVAPGPEGRYVAFVRRGETWAIHVPAGVVHAIDVPGEALADGAAGYKRTLSLTGVETARCGSLVFDDAIVTFELCEMGGPSRRDRALYGWAAAAIVLALVGGGTYKLSRVVGPGDRPQWGRPEPLASRDANVLRVKIGPDGKGASRPQAGRGQMLHATSKGTKKAQKKPPQLASVDKPHLGNKKAPKKVDPTIKPRTRDDRAGAGGAAQRRPARGGRRLLEGGEGRAARLRPAQLARARALHAGQPTTTPSACGTRRA